MKITVHSVRNYNSVTDSYDYPTGKRTAEEVDRLNKDFSGAALEIIPNTAEEIDRSQLDDQARYIPPAR